MANRTLEARHRLPRLPRPHPFPPSPETHLRRQEIIKNQLYTRQISHLPRVELLFSCSGSCSIRFFFVILHITSINCPMSTETIDIETERINRLKVVLAEKNRKGKWLAEQLGKNEATVSRWCSNTAQPSLEMLVKIASILKVDPRQLINGIY